MATIKDAEKQLTELLSAQHGEAEAASVAKLVLGELGGMTNLQLRVRANDPLPSLLAKQLERAVKELIKGVPAQYVIGHTWFLDCKIRVNPSVLIPRPETEELAYRIINDWRGKNCTILDIGTGSGCIPIALKKHLPKAEVHAAEKFTNALEIAKQNARQNKVDVNFIKTDFLNEADWQQLPQVDVLVSNPPYIPKQFAKKMEAHVVEHEPHAALFVDDANPLVFYGALEKFTNQKLNAGGKVYYELNENYAEETKNLFKKSSQSVQVEKDLQGAPRFLIAQY